MSRDARSQGSPSARIDALKSALARAEAEHALRTEERDRLLAALKEKYGVESVEDAEELLASERAKADEEEAALSTEIKELEAALES